MYGFRYFSGITYLLNSHECLEIFIPTQSVRRTGLLFILLIPLLFVVSWHLNTGPCDFYFWILGSFAITGQYKETQLTIRSTSRNDKLEELSASQLLKKLQFIYRTRRIINLKEDLVKAFTPNSKRKFFTLSSMTYSILIPFSMIDIS
jgi:hypothetical protein